MRKHWEICQRHNLIHHRFPFRLSINQKIRGWSKLLRSWINDYTPPVTGGWKRRGFSRRFVEFTYCFNFCPIVERLSELFQVGSNLKSLLGKCRKIESVLADCTEDDVTFQLNKLLPEWPLLPTTEHQFKSNLPRLPPAPFYSGSLPDLMKSTPIDAIILRTRKKNLIAETVLVSPSSS